MRIMSEVMEGRVEESKQKRGKGKRAKSTKQRKGKSKQGKRKSKSRKPGISKEDAAATKIQSIQRGRKSRKQSRERQEKDEAATKIQRIQRGRNARKGVVKREEEANRARTDQEEAATKIQALQRRNQAKKEYSRRKRKRDHKKETKDTHRLRVDQLFDKFDRDDTGMISEAEFRAMIGCLSKLRPELAMPRPDEAMGIMVLSDLDVNDEGEASKDEFMQWVSNMIMKPVEEKMRFASESKFNKRVGNLFDAIEGWLKSPTPLGNVKSATKEVKKSVGGQHAYDNTASRNKRKETAKSVSKLKRQELGKELRDRQLKNLRDLFDSFDKDKDGIILREEFQSLVMTFRSLDEGMRDPLTYKFVFHEGSFGMGIETPEGEIEGSIVTVISPNGQAENSNVICSGDRVIEVGGTDITHLDHEDTHALIVEQARPCTITFSRPLSKMDVVGMMKSVSETNSVEFINYLEFESTFKNHISRSSSQKEKYANQSVSHRGLTKLIDSVQNWASQGRPPQLPSAATMLRDKKIKNAQKGRGDKEIRRARLIEEERKEYNELQAIKAKKAEMRKIQRRNKRNAAKFKKEADLERAKKTSMQALSTAMNEDLDAPLPEAVARSKKNSTTATAPARPSRMKRAQATKAKPKPPRNPKGRERFAGKKRAPKGNVPKRNSANARQTKRVEAKRNGVNARNEAQQSQPSALEAQKYSLLEEKDRRILENSKAKDKSIGFGSHHSTVQEGWYYNPRHPKVAPPTLPYLSREEQHYASLPTDRNIAPPSNAVARPYVPDLWEDNPPLAQGGGSSAQAEQIAILKDSFEQQIDSLKTYFKGEVGRREDTVSKRKDAEVSKAVDDLKSHFDSQLREIQRKFEEEVTSPSRMQSADNGLETDFDHKLKQLQSEFQTQLQLQEQSIRQELSQRLESDPVPDFDSKLKALESGFQAQLQQQEQSIRGELRQEFTNSAQTDFESKLQEMQAGFAKQLQRQQETIRGELREQFESSSKADADSKLKEVERQLKTQMQRQEQTMRQELRRQFEHSSTANFDSKLGEMERKFQTQLQLQEQTMRGELLHASRTNVGPTRAGNLTASDLEVAMLKLQQQLDDKFMSFKEALTFQQQQSMKANTLADFNTTIQKVQRDMDDQVGKLKQVLVLEQQQKQTNSSSLADIEMLAAKMQRDLDERLNRLKSEMSSRQQHNSPGNSMDRQTAARLAYLEGKLSSMPSNDNSLNKPQFPKPDTVQQQLESFKDSFISEREADRRISDYERRLNKAEEIARNLESEKERLAAEKQKIEIELMQERFRVEQEKWQKDQEIAKAQTKDALVSMKDMFAAELREANKEYSRTIESMKARENDMKSKYDTLLQDQLELKKSLQQPKSWVCPTCRAINSSQSQYCEICEETSTAQYVSPLQRRRRVRMRSPAAGAALPPSRPKRKATKFEEWLENDDDLDDYNPMAARKVTIEPISTPPKNFSGVLKYKGGKVVGKVGGSVHKDLSKSRHMY